MLPADPADPRDDASPGAPGSDDARLTWKERELITALRRLARARSQVAQLEEAAAAPPPPEPADLERVEALEAEIDKLRRKAQGRFGAAAARERLQAAEDEQRRLLERMGFASVDELRAADGAPPPAGADPALLDFAQRELADAEQAYLEVLALPDPDEVDDGGDGAPAPLDGDGDGAAGAELIDLRGDRPL